MQFTVDQSVLVKVLSTVIRAVPSRPTHPILANILLEVPLDEVYPRLFITGFDLSLGIVGVCPIEPDIAGKVTVPAKLFYDIISRLQGEIEITFVDLSDSLTVEINSQAGKFNLRGVGADEYPKLPSVNQENKIILDGDIIRQGLKNTLFSSSTDDTKQILTGVHITKQDEHFEFASTDGHRLSVFKQGEFDKENEVDFSLTIPNKSLKEVAQLSGEINLSVDNGNILFFDDVYSIFCRHLDGSYPNYNQLIPVQFSRTLVTNRTKLIKALERVAVFCSDKNSMIKLSLGESIIISAESKELGNAKSTISGEFDGEPTQIGFNIKYLFEGLKSIDSNEVLLSMNEATQPVIITPLSGDNYKYLIMPVQIRD